MKNLILKIDTTVTDITRITAVEKIVGKDSFAWIVGPEQFVINVFMIAADFDFINYSSLRK